MRPIGRKDRLIDLNTFFVEYPVCAISVAVLVSGYCLTAHISFSLCFA